MAHKDIAPIAKVHMGLAVGTKSSHSLHLTIVAAALAFEAPLEENVEAFLEVISDVSSLLANPYAFDWPFHSHIWTKVDQMLASA
jgi:hypothetical protein